MELTHCKHSAAQAVALRSMGIGHRVRPGGTLAVFRAQAKDVPAGGSSEARPGTQDVPGGPHGPCRAASSMAMKR